MEKQDFEVRMVESGREITVLDNGKRLRGWVVCACVRQPDFDKACCFIVRLTDGGLIDVGCTSGRWYFGWVD